jgi:hypothetical protein
VPVTVTTPGFEDTHVAEGGTIWLVPFDIAANARIWLVSPTASDSALATVISEMVGDVDGVVGVAFDEPEH